MSKRSATVVGENRRAKRHMAESIFQKQWRECLREHYRDVVRRNDKVTLGTLQGVMAEVGFGEDELRELYVRASLRVEDMPDGFVPDPNLLATAKQGVATFTPHPAECRCPACMDKVDTARHDNDGQPLDADGIAEKAARQKHKKARSGS